jgi:uncharacterized protein (DUF58 family)
MSQEVAGASRSLAPYAELLDALSGLTWPSQQRVQAGDPGSHRSKRLGRSPEFTEYRAYRPGDDLRRLDWKLFARTDRPFLRIADDHAALRTAILVDASASMRFPVTGYGKWEHACAMAIGLAAVALGDGDAVGITVSTRAGNRGIPPRRRRDVLNDTANLFASVAVDGKDSLPHSIERAASEPRLTVISDFLCDSERALAALRVAAAAGAELYAVHVVAEEELNPPDRAFLASDPEDASLRRTLGSDNRGAYLAAFAAWRDGLAAELHAMNANYCLTSAREPVRDAVRRVIEVRERDVVST